MTVYAFSTFGGFTPGEKARIFDTSNPQNDLDLGSPHKYVSHYFACPYSIVLIINFPVLTNSCNYSRCAGGGVGVGLGGRPGSIGENCIPQGNVLIIQESDKDEADDNAGGGILCFDFEAAVEFVSLGLMDIAENRSDFIRVTEQGIVAPTAIEFEDLVAIQFRTFPST